MHIIWEKNLTTELLLKSLASATVSKNHQRQTTNGKQQQTTNNKQLQQQLIRTMCKAQFATTYASWSRSIASKKQQTTCNQQAQQAPGKKTEISKTTTTTTATATATATTTATTTTTLSNSIFIIPTMRQAQSEMTHVLRWHQSSVVCVSGQSLHHKCIQWLAYVPARLCRYCSFDIRTSTTSLQILPCFDGLDEHGAGKTTWALTGVSRHKAARTLFISLMCSLRCWYVMIRDDDDDDDADADDDDDDDDDDCTWRHVMR